MQKAATEVAEAEARLAKAQATLAAAQASAERRRAEVEALRGEIARQAAPGERARPLGFGPGTAPATWQAVLAYAQALAGHASRGNRRFPAQRLFRP